MLLKLLLSKAPTHEVHGSLDVEIVSLSYDSRQTQPGALFIAIAGQHSDGHDFILQAVRHGAAAVVTEHFVENLPSGVTQAVVGNARESLALLAAFFYHQPALKLKLAGVTGTNGKTTTTYLLKTYFANVQFWRCGLIGNGAVRKLVTKIFAECSHHTRVA